MKNHPYPEALKHISIDMFPAFISGTKTYFTTGGITI
jgi:hypothetical protein